MGRIRTIKPEFFISPDTAKASVEARIFFIALWCWADDWGVGDTNVNGLLGFAFPDSDERDRKEIQSLCKEVADAYDVKFYTVGERAFYQILTWDSHQKTQRRAARRKPNFDDPESVPDQRFSPTAKTQGNSLQTQGKDPLGKGKGTGEQGKGNSPAPAVLADGFEAAWKHWPKKVERKDAVERFADAVRRRDITTLVNDIIRFGQAYAATTERNLVPSLGRWLKGDRWDDDLPTPKGGARPSKDDQARDILAMGARLQQQEIEQ